MSMQLKISDQRHKQKLNLKALDAVLFGPPLRESARCFSTWTSSSFFFFFSAAFNRSPPDLLPQVRNTTG